MRPLPRQPQGPAPCAAAHVEDPQAGDIADQPGEVGILDGRYGIVVLIIGLGPERVPLERVRLLDDTRREEAAGLLARGLDALERADEALYEAKRTGKNRSCMA